MMAMIRFAYVMAVRRAVSGWRLEAVLFGGILLAVALMASGVIFSDLLANASLRHALDEAPAEDANFWVRSFSSQDEPATLAGRRTVYQRRLDFARERVFEPFEPYLREQAVILDTATFYFQGHPQLELDNDIRPRGSSRAGCGSPRGVGQARRTPPRPWTPPWTWRWMGWAWSCWAWRSAR